MDTGEYLGGPLTRVIDTYVGVAGPNRGASPQLGPLSVPACALSITPICNSVNGLYSGNCPAQSEFLQVRHSEKVGIVDFFYFRISTSTLIMRDSTHTQSTLKKIKWLDTQFADR